MRKFFNDRFAFKDRVLVIILSVECWNIQKNYIALIRYHWSVQSYSEIWSYTANMIAIIWRFRSECMSSYLRWSFPWKRKSLTESHHPDDVQSFFRGHVFPSLYKMNKNGMSSSLIKSLWKADSYKRNCKLISIICREKIITNITAKKQDESGDENIMD